VSLVMDNVVHKLIFTERVYLMDHLGVERVDVSRETLQSHVVPVRWEHVPR